MQKKNGVSLGGKYYSLLGVLVLVYFIAVFVLGSESLTFAQYGISESQLRFISLTITAPLFAIWFAGVYGLVNVSEYAFKIKKSPEGEGFTLLARALIFLGLLVPLAQVTSRLLSYGVEHGGISQAAATIIHSHLTVTFQLLGFFLLFLGTRRLAKTVRDIRLPRLRVAGAGVLLLLLSVLYLIAIFTNPSRETVQSPVVSATYAMPDWLILATIAAPHILVWGFGFFAALHLRAYYDNTRGKIYKNALMKLNKGFVVVILASILLQFLTAASASVFGWGPGVIILLTYVFLAVTAAGYIPIALGAKELKKLEEVT